MNENIIGPQRLLAAEPGWRVAFFRDTPEAPFEFSTVIAWAICVEKPGEYDEGAIHSSVEPVVMLDGRPDCGATEDMTFARLFAPGEEPDEHDLYEHACWMRRRKERK